jgi:hypothetical protein
LNHSQANGQHNEEEIKEEIKKLTNLLEKNKKDGMIRS